MLIHCAVCHSLPSMPLLQAHRLLCWFNIVFKPWRCPHKFHTNRKRNDDSAVLLQIWPIRFTTGDWCAGSEYVICQQRTELTLPTAEQPRCKQGTVTYNSRVTWDLAVVSATGIWVLHSRFWTKNNSIPRFCCVSHHERLWARVYFDGIHARPGTRWRSQLYRGLATGAM